MTNPFASNFNPVATYYEAWESIDRIDPQYCNIAYFAFFDPDNEGNIKTQNNDRVKEFINLKNSKKDIKLLASIGGAHIETDVFSHIAENSTIRTKFVKNALQLTLKHGFDGVDIDWEYPVERFKKVYDKTADMQNFIYLLSELRGELDKYNKYLTIAACAGTDIGGKAYNIKEINKHVHAVNLMTYDYQHPTNVLGHNAPFNQVKRSVEWWIEKGMEPEKILLGIPAYGYKMKTDGSFVINETKCIEIERVPISSGDIKNLKGCERKWDSNENVPYIITNDNFWISYDDESSIQRKMDIVCNNKLLGIFFWSSNKDYFWDNSCREQKAKFPLLKKACELSKNHL